MSGVPPSRPAPDLPGGLATSWSFPGGADLRRLQRWVDDERSQPLRVDDKAAAPQWVGRPLRSFADDPGDTADQPTPCLTLSRPALAHNIAEFAAWASDHGLAHAPHGKTTMAPSLWLRQLRAGAWGITLATETQLRIAVAAGVPRVLVANLLIRPGALAWLATVDQTEVICWVDSLEAVALMESGLMESGLQESGLQESGLQERAMDGTSARLPVLVELGTVRTGARTVEAALEVAAAVARSPHLELVGVGCYEGVAVSGHTPEDAAVVRTHLTQLATLAEVVRPLVRREQVLVTAGGSTWFDLVAEVLGESSGRTLVVVRSGSVVSHDDGTYASSTPAARGADGPALRPALHLWARVLAITPAPGSGTPRARAILDAGKRDFPFDSGLPVPQLAVTRQGFVPLEGHRLVGSNDQHATMAITPDSPLRVGSVVRLGISHPCTAFDKWRTIPVLDDADALDARVVDWVRTWF